MGQRATLFGRIRYLLRNYIVHGRVRVFLQYLFAKFQGLLIQPVILPYFISFYPYRKSSYSYVLRRPAPRSEADTDSLPMPPERLWLSYGLTADDWLSSGKTHTDNMLRLLQESGHVFSPGTRVLELGCAAGRMIRWLKDLSGQCEMWGTDISGEHIVWCKQHLSPPFHFFITTTAPHLPFEDRYFDLIYAGSVFTHIDDLADTWLMELRRVLRPGGRLYITIHDQDTIRVLNDNPHYLRKTLYCHKDYFADGDYSMFTIGRFMWSQVFYDRDRLIEMLEPFFEVNSVTPEAYGFQTAVLLQKK